jgi:hypothetical protein
VFLGGWKLYGLLVDALLIVFRKLCDNMDACGLPIATIRPFDGLIRAGIIYNVYVNNADYAML